GVGLLLCRQWDRASSSSMAMSGTGQGFFSFVVAGGAVDVDSVGVVVTAVRVRHRLQWPSSPWRAMVRG
ncbi:hypothetical protein Dimus_020203, partial [Dionaea muscipula]